jgi:hypothetical protein
MSPKRVETRTGPVDDRLVTFVNPHNLTPSQRKKQVDHGYTLTAVCSTVSNCCFWYREIRTIRSEAIFDNETVS